MIREEEEGIAVMGNEGKKGGEGRRREGKEGEGRRREGKEGEEREREVREGKGDSQL